MLQGVVNVNESCTLLSSKFIIILLKFCIPYLKTITLRFQLIWSKFCTLTKLLITEICSFDSIFIRKGRAYETDGIKRTYYILNARGRRGLLAQIHPRKTKQKKNPAKLSQKKKVLNIETKQRNILQASERKCTESILSRMKTKASRKRLPTPASLSPQKYNGPSPIYLFTFGYVTTHFCCYLSVGISLWKQTRKNKRRLISFMKDNLWSLTEYSWAKQSLNCRRQNKHCLDRTHLCQELKYFFILASLYPKKAEYGLF